ncbi:hypothetical protein RFI_17197 [Reticulomyxa filosa]|uniref:UBA domain-containing protein n=1 Tax=Reticulomyxa filosa TaxID=46433 RepID=X6N287_RETFI|nr:hypothetical protein RFI_17197 [Reticulomyxa filosa]|eukprot:ETO20023.1 hypothetical protein RFI_17197 [Reticulomyxa filosa]
MDSHNKTETKKKEELPELNPNQYGTDSWASINRNSALRDLEMLRSRETLNEESLQQRISKNKNQSQSQSHAMDATFSSNESDSKQYQRQPLARKPYDAELVDESDPGDLLTNADATMTWTVRNCGLSTFGEQCKLAFVEGDGLLVTGYHIPDCKPGDTTCVSMRFDTFSTPGSYETFFRLMCGSVQFGPLLRVKITVVDKPVALAPADNNNKNAIANANINPNAVPMQPSAPIPPINPASQSQPISIVPPYAYPPSQSYAYPPPMVCTDQPKQQYTASKGRGGGEGEKKLNVRIIVLFLDTFCQEVIIDNFFFFFLRMIIKYGMQGPPAVPNLGNPYYNNMMPPPAMGYVDNKGANAFSDPNRPMAMGSESLQPSLNNALEDEQAFENEAQLVLPEPLPKQKESDVLLCVCGKELEYVEVKKTYKFFQKVYCDLCKKPQKKFVWHCPGGRDKKTHSGGFDLCPSCATSQLGHPPVIDPKLNFDEDVVDDPNSKSKANPVGIPLDTDKGAPYPILERPSAPDLNPVHNESDPKFLYPKQLKELLDMGFDEDKARRSLLTHRGDMSAALGVCC